jgi:hypothetical protein
MPDKTGTATRGNVAWHNTRDRLEPPWGWYDRQEHWLRLHRYQRLSKFSLQIETSKSQTSSRRDSRID